MILRLGQSVSALVVAPAQLGRPPLEWNRRHPGRHPQQGAVAASPASSAEKRRFRVTQTGAAAQSPATVAGPQKEQLYGQRPHQRSPPPQ